MGTTVGARSMADVLLSTDLMPRILATLPIVMAPALVCRSWRDSWVQSIDEKRALRPALGVSFPTPYPTEPSLLRNIFSMKAVGSWLLVEASSGDVKIMRMSTAMVQQSTIVGADRILFSTESDMLYVTHDAEGDDDWASSERGVVSYSILSVGDHISLPTFHHEAHNLDVADVDDGNILNGVAYKGSLYIVKSPAEDNQKFTLRELSILDLAPKHVHRLDFRPTIALAVHADEVFIGDSTLAGTIKVLSTSAMHLRTITLPREKLPQAASSALVHGLLVHTERLYVTTRSHCVFILSANAPHALLQICKGGPEGSELFAMCLDKNRLLVSDNGLHQIRCFDGV